MARKPGIPSRVEGDTIGTVHHTRSGRAHTTAVGSRPVDHLRAVAPSPPADAGGVPSGAARCTAGAPDGAVPVPDVRGVGHGRVGGPPGSASGTPEERIRRVIGTARDQTGRGYSYSWGAGGYGGASFGISSPSPDGHYDHDVLGFDCSGLTLYAFWRGAGIDIGVHPEAQYGHAWGRRVPYGQRRPGDLVFWGEGGRAATHVALYVGDDRIIESSWPRGADSVAAREVHGDALPDVVRFIE